MYTNLWKCTQERKGENDRAGAPAVQVTNDYLIDAIRQVDGLIETFAEQGFAPRLVSYTLNVDPNTVDVALNQLNLKHPHLTITSVKVDGTELEQWDGQSATRNDADYHVTPRKQTPFYDLQGMQDGIWIPADSRHFIDGIEVDGITCYRRNYPSEGWMNSGDTVQDNPLSNSTNTLNVSNAAVSQFGSSAPRFSEGDLLQIESEWLRVWAINENTLTVERGVRGSTAVQHAQNTSIYVWQPEPEIIRAATRWVIYMAKRRAIYETLKIDAGGAGQMTISSPSRMPEETETILNLFKNPSNKLLGVS